MTHSTLAIVLLNYNGLEHLQKFLPALVQQTTDGVNVYVIDNASTDESVAWLHQSLPQVHVITLPANAGFAGGYNQGLKQVKASWYLLLNNDIEVPAGFCDAVSMAISKSSEPIIMQCTMRSHAQPQWFEYAGAMGGWIDSLGYPFCVGRVLEHCEADEGQYAENVKDLMWASGGAMLLPASVFWQVEGFYAPLFMQNEDIDLCWRALNKGIAVKPLPQAVVYHVGAGSLGWQHPQKTYYTFRSNIIMLLRMMPIWRLCWVLPLRAMLDAAAAGRYLLTGKAGQAWAICRGWGGALAWWLKPAQNKWAGKRHMPATGWYKGSVVWAYFIQGRKTFAGIVRG